MYFSKMPVLSVEISLEKLWEKFRSHGRGMVSHKSDSVLGSVLGLSAFSDLQSTLRFVPPRTISPRGRGYHLFLFWSYSI